MHHTNKNGSRDNVLADIHYVEAILPYISWTYETDRLAMLQAIVTKQCNVIGYHYPAIILPVSTFCPTAGRATIRSQMER